MVSTTQSVHSRRPPTIVVLAVPLGKRSRATAMVKVAAWPTIPSIAFHLSAARRNANIPARATTIATPATTARNRSVYLWSVRSAWVATSKLTPMVNRSIVRPIVAKSRNACRNATPSTIAFRHLCATTQVAVLRPRRAGLDRIAIVSYPVLLGGRAHRGRCS